VAAEARFARIAEVYADAAPKRATWLEPAIPRASPCSRCPSPTGHAVLPADPIERAIQQELERRTRKRRVFPNEAAIERLATAILVEIDEPWTATDRAYVTMTNQDG